MTKLTNFWWFIKIIFILAKANLAWSTVSLIFYLWIFFNANSSILILVIKSLHHTLDEINIYLYLFVCLYFQFYLHVYSYLINTTLLQMWIIIYSRTVLFVDTYSTHIRSYDATCMLHGTLTCVPVDFTAIEIKDGSYFTNTWSRLNTCTLVNNVE